MSDFLFSITVTKAHLTLIAYLSLSMLFFFCLYFFHIMRGVKKHLDELIEKHRKEYENMLADNEEAKAFRAKINDEMIAELKKLKQIVSAFHRSKPHDDN